MKMWVTKVETKDMETLVMESEVAVEESTGVTTLR